ncbi:sugar phosphate nucleotidyltransferase [Bulleidia sp. zg-1006]|uniref:nucleotidyltransferase family protein n=1 Tax=Bulleidia sp. zg-1006 TaxID=2806552 RepID=UPI00193A6AE5|nr:sugar phosphate nucleotidyltransferase [Bulleidia sp. zg-1006]QRG86407.1 NTP transferase domain-containing protein [Bulleidia sp. zg-1006]
MNHQKPTLVILAAGLGSRYGGMKQIDGVGSHGEPIIEFSIYDAKEAGFEQVVLIIQHQHEALFKKALTDRVAQKMDVQFAFQDVNDIPGEAIERSKPWGTVQALLSCQDIVKGPFAIINADDYYGKDAYRSIYQFLSTKVSENHYAMVGYHIKETVTENGSVTRGVCDVNEQGYLKQIIEIKEIYLKDKQIHAKKDGQDIPLDNNCLVSMNFWAFHPSIYAKLMPLWKEFVAKARIENPEKAEYVIPTAIGQLVQDKQIQVEILDTSDKWFGITYQEDKPMVVRNIAELKKNGSYPDVLWKETD